MAVSSNEKISGRGMRSSRQQRFVRLTGLDNRSNARASGAQLLHNRRELWFVDEQRGLGVPQDARQLRGGKTHIERHNDPTRQNHAVIAFQQLVGIEAQVRDAPARLEPLC